MHRHSIYATDTQSARVFCTTDPAAAVQKRHCVEHMTVKFEMSQHNVIQLNCIKTNVCDSQ